MSSTYVIKLPKDKELVKNLQKKLKEYKKRLKEKFSDLYRIDAICKIAVLEPLLQNGIVDTKNLLAELKRGTPGFEPGDRLDNAYAVIKDYCETGGMNNHGGTGLK